MKMKNKRRLAAAILLTAALRIVFPHASAAAGETAAPAGAQHQQRVISQPEAFRLMLAEADKGNAAAMLTVGTMYERGMGTPRNFVKAFEFYRKAAEAGLAEGHYNVGVCYEIGMGNGGDIDLAFQSFEEAAKLGLTQALYKLAEFYIAGAGVQKNEAWGVELLGRAAAKGHMVACNDLGAIYYEGRLGQTKDVSRAYEWFVRSADLGYGEAMKNLGVMYRDGIGVPADAKQALKWFALARLAGMQIPAIEAAMTAIRENLTEGQIKEVEAEAQVWIDAFQKRQQAQRQQSPE